MALPFARILLAVLGSVAFFALTAPAHEYGHCVGSWARGGSDECQVTFYAKPWESEAFGRAHGIGDDDHAWIYPLQVGSTFAVTTMLTLWAMRGWKPKGAA